MTSNKKEMYSGIFFILLAILYFIGASSIKHYEAFTSGGVNSSTIPKGLAILMFILGLVQSIGAYRKSKDNAGIQESTYKDDDSKGILEKSMEIEEEIIVEGQKNRRSIVLTFVFLIILASLIEKIGFIIMSITFLICQMTLLTEKANRRKSLRLIVFLSVVFSVGVYYLFTKGFSLILPTGILG